jgi:hypothetical protein
MLTLSQQVIFEDLAKKIVNELKLILKTKNIPRKSVRYENGERVTRKFASPVSATGKLANSVKFEITDTAILIKADSYIYTLIYGRKPTSNKGSWGAQAKDDIKRWISAKGIRADIDENQLAYLITRKITREGNSIYLFSGSNNSGLLNNILTQALKQEFSDKFTKDFKEGIIQEFNGNQSNT